MLSKEFPAGLLVITGANSAAGLRSMDPNRKFGSEFSMRGVDPNRMRY
jgi:hypothetical protein